MKEEELVNALIESHDRGEKFSAMTNEELADLLMNTVWTNMDLFTPESDLLQAVIDRLKGDK